MLVVVGTSLKIKGIVDMVESIAEEVHARKGSNLVVFVNKTGPPKSMWGGVFDTWVEGEADRWVEKVQEDWGREAGKGVKRQSVLSWKGVKGGMSKVLK